MLRPLLLFNFKRIQNKSIVRNIYCGSKKKIDSKILDRYSRLPLPCDKILATYVWIDGSGIHMRSKDKIISASSLQTLTSWTFDGSSTGQASQEDSEVTLQPQAVYNDPFYLYPNVLILCDTYAGNGKPTKTNHRQRCDNLFTKHKDRDPWIGIEQEYTLTDTEGYPLGGQKRYRYPRYKWKYSYCGVGSTYAVGREICEAHALASLYAGLDFGGTNAEVTRGTWEFQVGTSKGIKGADDLWMGRYILKRIAESFGIDVTFYPKPYGLHNPGNGCHHNFSTKEMRACDGYKHIEKAINQLKTLHTKHISQYSIQGHDNNKGRLTGKFETSSYEKFSWGVGDRTASVRVSKSVHKEQKGFFEDRRPAGDCDPYVICSCLLEVI